MGHCILVYFSGSADTKLLGSILRSIGNGFVFGYFSISVYTSCQIWLFLTHDQHSKKYVENNIFGSFDNVLN